MKLGLTITGVLVGYESKPIKDGKGTRTVALIGCGVDAYRVIIRAEEVPKLYEIALYETVCVGCRPSVFDGRLFWTDGFICGNGEGC